MTTAWSPPPPAQRWLLIEQEGAWPINALDAFPTNVARRIAAIARSGRGCPCFADPPSRLAPREDRPIRWAFADVRPSNEGIRWGEAASAADLLDMPWEVSPGEGEPVAIVAHSRHDVCCAMKGRPVAQSLTDQWPGRVWECSHQEGQVRRDDGPAANRLVLAASPSTTPGLCSTRTNKAVRPGPDTWALRLPAPAGTSRAILGAPRVQVRPHRRPHPAGNDCRPCNVRGHPRREPFVTVRARESTVPLGTLPRAGRRCWQKRGNTR